jgi:hypothetical protein
MHETVPAGQAAHGEVVQEGEVKNAWQVPSVQT